MAAPKTKAEPNRNDPLSEHTLQRRLWAAYLRAGFTRAEFSRALGVRYATCQAWDNGESIPDLMTFGRAAQLVGYSMDELAFGPANKRATRVEQELSREGIKDLLLELNASGEQRIALGEHEMSPAGRYQRYTRTYIATFISAYAKALDAGNKRDAAIESAMVEATRARALADAVSSGIKPVAEEALRNAASPRTTKVKRPKNP